MLLTSEPSLQLESVLLNSHVPADLYTRTQSHEKYICVLISALEETLVLSMAYHLLLLLQSLGPKFLSRGPELTPAQKSDQQVHSAPVPEACGIFLDLFLPWTLT